MTDILYDQINYNKFIDHNPGERKTCIQFTENIFNFIRASSA